MGMYTELVLKCNIREDAPDDVKAVLKHMFAGRACPDKLPEHAFFGCPRWDFIGNGSSFYHHPKALSDYWMGHGDAEDRGGYIFSRSDLKNYNGEIELFIDWLRPYIDEEDEQCIGWVWYEEETEPTLIFKKAKETT